MEGSNSNENERACGSCEGFSISKKEWELRVTIKHESGMPSGPEPSELSRTREGKLDEKFSLK